MSIFSTKEKEDTKLSMGDIVILTEEHCRCWCDCIRLGTIVRVVRPTTDSDNDIKVVTHDLGSEEYVKLSKVRLPKDLEEKELFTNKFNKATRYDRARI